MQGKDNEKEGEGSKAPPHQVEDTVSQQHTVMQDQRNVTVPDDQAVPQNYTLIEHQPLFVQEAQVNLSVLFQNYEGQKFVSLNIAPAGKESSVHSVLKGYTEEFTSSVGVFNVQILDIDYNKRKVVLQVNRKI